MQGWKDGIYKCRSKTSECAANRIANVAGPSQLYAKVISRGMAVSVPTLTTDHSFLAIKNLSRAFTQGHCHHCFAI